VHRAAEGVPTVIADLRGPEHVVASGNPGLATGGSGDLLAGFIAHSSPRNGAGGGRGAPARTLWVSAELGRASGRRAACGPPTCWRRFQMYGGRGGTRNPVDLQFS